MSRLAPASVSNYFNVDPRDNLNDERTSTGSEPGFRQLFETEYVYVCRALCRLGVKSGDVPDVAQELFMLVHRELPSFDTARAVRPWLFAFAVRLASNHRRLARHRTSDADTALTDLGDHIAPSERHHARDMVLRALERLDEDKRTVLVLHDLEGFEAKEVAEMTGALVNTVYSRLRLARTAFRTALETLAQVQPSTPDPNAIASSAGVMPAEADA
jgi:RNA polymerase sigma-70 factor, ECF subfamily